MDRHDIIIKGAREHNLRDVNVSLPRNEMICLTGVSGSGKSSLAFDTLYAEGQRRYIESLSSFARQFVGQMPKPDVDFVGGLSPSISISQKSAGSNPRSTVGTMTEVYDYLRVLFATIGVAHCPECGKAVEAQSLESIVASILALPEGTEVSIFAPLVRRKKGTHQNLFAAHLKRGYSRARVDGLMIRLADAPKLNGRMQHDVDLLIEGYRLDRSMHHELTETVKTALRLGDGIVVVGLHEDTKDRDLISRDVMFSSHHACHRCEISLSPLTPQLFSFNSPQGMCDICHGLGEADTFTERLIITQPNRSMATGCCSLLGSVKKWPRRDLRLLQQFAKEAEQRHKWACGSMLEQPWRDLSEAQRNAWLHGPVQERGDLGSGNEYPGILGHLEFVYERSTKKRRQKMDAYREKTICPGCAGARLNSHACHVAIWTEHPDLHDAPKAGLPDLCRMSISQAAKFFEKLKLTPTEQIIAAELLKEIRGRLGFLQDVGLDYLSLDRTAPTLSGGESQRIRLAGQIGCGLVGVVYILDEPSIGLHPRDNDRLIGTLGQLRDLGNTVVVVEHDEDTMRAADRLIDFGPGAGIRGGKVTGAGSIQDLADAPQSVTGKFLSGERQIEVPCQRRLPRTLRTPKVDRRLLEQIDPAEPARTGRRGWASAPSELPAPGTHWLTVCGARHNNLKDVDVTIPLGAFVCVTGVSGSGKSSLVNDILVAALRRDLNRGEETPGEHDGIVGLEHLDKMIAIDQTPIGRTPRSNPGTYIKLFDEIRKLFTQLPLSKQRGYLPGRFSFNVKGGRCEACEGNGSTRLEMDFLADVWVPCPVCEGHRFNRETLAVRYKGKSIADVLEMDVQEALEFFDSIPTVRRRLQTLHDVGLDYMKIGQPSPTLSGGEAQRIKLARELVKRSTGKTLYLLDEPTTGLHFADIEMLLNVLHSFVDAGNTVLVVEHNLEVVKTADWVIDLGPEGGAAGGRLVTTGTPERVAACKESYTGKALRPLLRKRNSNSVRGKPARSKKQTNKGRTPRQEPLRFLQVQGAKQHNLKNVDLKLPRDKMSVFCGPSGSGKSSLAMDTIYAEGQRRYVESLSSYARQFVSQVQKPALDSISGLSPAIAIEQQNLGNSPRSTVGTSTEIYDYLRILMARLGIAHCPNCDEHVGTQTADQIVDKIMSFPDESRLVLAAPLSMEGGVTPEQLWEELQAEGYRRVRVDGEIYQIDDVPAIDRRQRAALEVVVDRVTISQEDRGRIAESVEQALAIGRGVMIAVVPREGVVPNRWPTTIFSQHRVCEGCGRSFEPLTPHSFSFNSPLGWCPACDGLGKQIGANPAALVCGKMTLADGAMLVWPSVHQPVGGWMLKALAQQTGIPLDTPFDQLDARQRRLMLHGTGDMWVAVYASTGPGQKSIAKKKRSKEAKEQAPLFRFQYKGIYPALEEAARLSYSFRAKIDRLVDEVECSACGGSRIREEAAAVRLRGKTLDQLCRMPLGTLHETIRGWKFDERERKIAGELIRELRDRISFLNDVGLDYLTLARGAATLSGGEAQRIRLASQLGSGLCGILYVLDEPTIGLHPRDNHRLLNALHRLRDLGNTLVVVEHDRDVIAGSDHIVDFGPAAGRFGGQVVASGTSQQIVDHPDSVTGPYLTGAKGIPIRLPRRLSSDDASCLRSVQPALLRPDDQRSRTTNERVRRNGREQTGNGKQEEESSESPLANDNLLRRGLLTVRSPRHNNLQGVDIHFPLGTMVAVTGVSGSGKSSLVNDILFDTLAKQLHRAQTAPGEHGGIEGVDSIKKVVRVDQQPLGNSPSSTPATVTGAFDHIRKIFASQTCSAAQYLRSGDFSFNTPGGRCEDCEGNGQKRIEMHFLPDVWVTCETCQGRRYQERTLRVLYNGHSIADVLEMTCAEALNVFSQEKPLRRILQTLCDVGLDYMTLGQPAPTLSGGEAQRVKLASELARPVKEGGTLYLLDEPTTGLHFDDLRKLLDVLHRLVDEGNTVIVIEHNLDVIKTADWIIDMGPEAGERGGHVVVAGTPEQLVEQMDALAQQGRTKKKPPTISHTAIALKPVLEAGPLLRRPVDPRQASGEPAKADASTDHPPPATPDSTSPPSAEIAELAIVDEFDDAALLQSPELYCITPWGEPVEWNTDALPAIVQMVQEIEGLRHPVWTDRGLLIRAASPDAPIFFDATLNDPLALIVRLRCAPKAFSRRAIRLFDEQLRDASPIDPRTWDMNYVRSRTVESRWQEVIFRVISWNETIEECVAMSIAHAGQSFTAHLLASEPEYNEYPG